MRGFDSHSCKFGNEMKQLNTINWTDENHVEREWWERRRKKIKGPLCGCQNYRIIIIIKIHRVVIVFPYLQFPMRKKGLKK